MTTPTAGWYPDGHGATRWWDGTAWTEHVQGADQSAASTAVGGDAAPTTTTVTEAPAVAAPQAPDGAGALALAQAEIERLRAAASAGGQPRQAQAGMAYVVLQVILREKLWGTGSGNLTELERAINAQAALGYRLHTISTASSGSKGLGGGDRIQATMVFERLT